MIFKTAFLLAAIAGFSFIACNSSTFSSNTDDVATIEAHSWKTTALTAAPPVNKSGVLITDIYDSLEKACERHEVTTFRSDGKVITSTDSAACNISTGGGQQYADTGTWSFNAPTLTVVNFDGVSNNTTIYSLVSASETALKMTWGIPVNKVPDGVAHTATQTYAPL